MSKLDDLYWVVVYGWYTFNTAFQVWGALLGGGYEKWYSLDRPYAEKECAAEFWELLNEGVDGW
jgi:hypothetical protein